MTTILVIEDNADFRHLVVGMLETAGYTVLAAKNGREGMKLVQANPPDLIISDVLMPEFDGVEVLRAIAQSAEPRPPIIMMTGGGNGLPAASLLQISKVFGAAETLFKPFRRRELLEAVVRLLKAGGAA
jgi:CheY-like chemotaxis protein